MAKTYLITLDATTSPGPFNIYYNTVSSDSLIAASPSTSDKASLLLGVYITVSNDVKSIFLENIATGCGNLVEVYTLPPATPTATPTSTPTATPTSTPTSTSTATPIATSTAMATPTSTATAMATPTSTATAMATPTATPLPPTPTATCANNCEYYTIFISSTDLNASYNNTVVVDYKTCFGAGATGSISYNAAGTYVNAVCVDSFAIPQPDPDIYYYSAAPPGNKVTATNSSGSINGFCCF